MVLVCVDEDIGADARRPSVPPIWRAGRGMLAALDLPAALVAARSVPSIYFGAHFAKRVASPACHLLVKASRHPRAYHDAWRF